MAGVAEQRLRTRAKRPVASGQGSQDRRDRHSAAVDRFRRRAGYAADAIESRRAACFGRRAARRQGQAGRLGRRRSAFPRHQAEAALRRHADSRAGESGPDQAAKDLRRRSRQVETRFRQDGTEAARAAAIWRRSLPPPTLPPTLPEPPKTRPTNRYERYAADPPLGPELGAPKPLRASARRRAIGSARRREAAAAGARGCPAGAFSQRAGDGIAAAGPAARFAAGIFLPRRCRSPAARHARRARPQYGDNDNRRGETTSIVARTTTTVMARRTRATSRIVPPRRPTAARRRNATTASTKSNPTTAIGRFPRRSTASARISRRFSSTTAARTAATTGSSRAT